MASYKTRTQSIVIAGTSFEITSLKDKSQFYDPEGEAEKIGISSAMWPIFGLVWPSSVVLAKIINGFDLGNKRILEVGCGIAVASIVAASKSADVTASDYHPFTETFLTKNVDANKIAPIKYFHGDWRYPITGEGKFDLIVGSDLLYEAMHAEQLATFIHCHLSQDGIVILVDPGRRTANKIKKSMAVLGFKCLLEIIDNEGFIKKGGGFKKYQFSRESQ
ncbi:MAG: methyltransferase domain-containing protein [Cellvibrionaceae bacterium]